MGLGVRVARDHRVTFMWLSIFGLTDFNNVPNMFAKVLPVS